MKSLILISLTTCILYANGLESFLAKKDPNHKEQKEEIKYFVIGKTNILHKVTKKDLQPFSLSGGIIPPSEINPNQDMPTSANYQANEKTLINMKSYANNYTNDEKRDLIKSIKTDILEEIILKYFNMPKSINKYGIKEKVIISFDIDNKNNISNIQFIQPSAYEDINKTFEEAIIKSSQEIPTPNQKETKKLYYEFDI